MIQQIKSFKVGDKFRVVGKFANIYKDKTFEVVSVKDDRLFRPFLSAKAFNRKGESDGQTYCFDQVNFDAYGDAVKRL